MEHNKNIVLGPHYQVRLSDLEEWHFLAAKCALCDREQSIDPPTLRRRWPSYTRLVDLEPRLKCRGCGNRACNTLAVRKRSRNW